MQASPSSGIPESGPPIWDYIVFMYSSICFFYFSWIYSLDSPYSSAGLSHIDIVFLFFLSSFEGSLLFTIAKPTFDLFKDPTSFVPSPHIIVIYPSLFKFPTMKSFWLGLVLEKTWIHLIILEISFLVEIYSRISPLIQSI